MGHWSFNWLIIKRESGFLTECPQSFSILIDIPSSPWFLLEFKPCINFSILFESISTVLSLLEVSKLWIDGRVLLFGIGWHCLLKKSLKILALSLKLVTSLLLTSIGGTSLLLTSAGTFFTVEKSFDYWPVCFCWSIRVIELISKSLIINIFWATYCFC